MSDKKKILIIQPIHKAGIELLDGFSDYEYEIVEDTNIENLKSIISDCDGLSIRTAKLPSEVIELGKKLKSLELEWRVCGSGILGSQTGSAGGLSGIIWRGENEKWGSLQRKFSAHGQGG